jgi:hypothetical protein
MGKTPHVVMCCANDYVLLRFAQEVFTQVFEEVLESRGYVSLQPCDMFSLALI